MLVEPFAYSNQWIIMEWSLISSLTSNESVLVSISEIYWRTEEGNFLPSNFCV